MRVKIHAKIIIKKKQSLRGCLHQTILEKLGEKMVKINVFLVYLGSQAMVQFFSVFSEFMVSEGLVGYQPQLNLLVTLRYL